MTWKPRTFLALLVAGMGCWLERQAAAQIEYLKAENRLLRSRLGRRRIVFTDAERSTLATLAKEIGTKALRALDPLVSPATLFALHRELVALKWTFLERRQPGRPRTTVDIEHLIVRIAIENPGWGYTRIQGALRNLELNIGRGTIRRILKDQPDRADAGARPSHSVVGVSQGAFGKRSRPVTSLQSRYGVGGA